MSLNLRNLLVQVKELRKCLTEFSFVCSFLVSQNTWKILNTNLKKNGIVHFWEDFTFKKISRQKRGVTVF